MRARSVAVAGTGWQPKNVFARHSEAGTGSYKNQIVSHAKMEWGYSPDADAAIFRTPLPSPRTVAKIHSSPKATRCW